MALPLKDPRTPRLEDPNAERARRRQAEAILELQSKPGASERIIADVSLADTIETPIAHGLGRAPSFVHVSAPRGAVTTGHVEEVRSNSVDRTKTITLKASGWGATITVDVSVK